MQQWSFLERMHQLQDDITLHYISYMQYIQYTEMQMHNLS